MATPIAIRKKPPVATPTKGAYSGDMTKEEYDAATEQGRLRNTNLLLGGESPSGDGEYDKPDITGLEPIDIPNLEVGGMWSPGKDPGTRVLLGGYDKNVTTKYGFNAYPDNWSYKDNAPRNTTLPVRGVKNFVVWQKGDPIPRTIEDYTALMDGKARKALTDADHKEIREIAKKYPNSDMTPEENLEFHTKNYIKNDKGGYPDFEQWVDYIGLAKGRGKWAVPAESKGGVPAESKQDPEKIKSMIANVQAMKAAQDAANANAPKAYSAGSAEMARKAMRGQTNPGRPNDNIDVKRYNDKFSGRPGSKNKAIGPRVVRRRIGN